MNILITGCAGFIGYSLSKKLLLNKKINVLGFDNLNNYYSLKLKKYRIKQLKKFKNFSFQKLDLKDKNKLSNYFKKNQIDIIFHLAAQAGVRYVSSHPEKFIESNIFGFHNLIEVSKLNDKKKFFYASSSSVYGDRNKFPVDEKSKLNPKIFMVLAKKLMRNIF